MSPLKVAKIIKGMNKKAAAVPGDLPMRVISEFSEEFSKPLSHLINNCLSQGIYPKIWKIEYVTPVPKVFPPEQLKDLIKSKRSRIIRPKPETKPNIRLPLKEVEVSIANIRFWLN